MNQHSPIERGGDQPSQEPKSQPIFLMPASVTALALFLLAVHAAFEMVLDVDTQLMFAVWFGFLPIRLIEPGVIGGYWPLLWTPFSHALLHGSWSHVFLNVAWLVIFGTPVARRYGGVAFYVAFFIGALAGVIAFTAAQWGDLHILVGASGGVAGLTGLSMRFMFEPVELIHDPETNQIRAAGRKLLPLSKFFTNPRVRAFTLIWMGLNLAIPVYAAFTGSQGGQIAWQAHIGGFVGGLLLADLFERRKPQ